jgi:hypothetical protein
MRLILHIGTQKTATTTIQQYLYHNRAVLAKNGIVLSDVLGKPNNRKLSAYCLENFQGDEFFKGRGIGTVAQKEAFFEGFEEEFRAEVTRLADTADCMVITSEHLWSRLGNRADLEKLHAFLAPLFSEIRVVCYFREQTAMAKSLYSTGIKSGITKEFKEAVRKLSPTRRVYNYHQSFLKWADVFGKDHLQARLFQREQFHKGDICADFLQIVDERLNSDDFAQLETNKNESMGYRGLELGRINNQVNPEFLKGGQVNPIRRHIINGILKTRFSQQGALDFRAAAEIHARFDECNRAFAAEFLGQSDNPFPPLRGGAADGTEGGPITQEDFTTFWEEFLTAIRNIPVLAPAHRRPLRDMASRIKAGKTLSSKDAALLERIAGPAGKGAR